MATDLERLLEHHPLPTWRIFAWPVMVLMMVLLIWANFADLEEVAVATGEVVPQGKIKVIQHLEGGIIEEIYVTEGGVVHVGTPLVQLDLASGGTNIKELQVRLDAQKLIRARLEAEATGSAIVFPEDVSARQPVQAAAELQNFEARKRQLESSLSVLSKQVRQKELEVEELQARQRSVTTNLKLARERFRMSQSLLSEGLTARMEHLQLEAEVEKLDGEMKSLAPAIPRARSVVSEAQERVREDEIKFRREAQEKLGETEQSIGRINELLSQATEQGIRAEIKSPIEGVVKNMRYNTIGGVVKAGEPIMEIVPTGGNLVIDAKLNPTDRGYVNVGQPATVKISTYDFARYGGLDGRVIAIAPDSSTDEKGIPFFRLVVQTDRTWLGERRGELPILPGMQATVDVHTGKKSVMDYLIKPVLKLRHEAFRER